MATKRTIVYVDGFNLYYRALRRTEFKWLNIDALCREVLDEANDIVAIKYYTADISGKDDPQAPVRQQRYLRALKTIPHLSVHKGRFLLTERWAPVASNGASFLKPEPDVARVTRREEKGSDVNLASHLLSDGFRDNYDVAVVITNDTDLTEPIRIVAEELKKPVGVICPSPKIAGDLQRVASFVRKLSHARLRAAQFPDEIEGTSLRRPESWSQTHLTARRDLEKQIRRALDRGEYSDVDEDLWQRLLKRTRL